MLKNDICRQERFPYSVYAHLLFFLLFPSASDDVEDTFVVSPRPEIEPSLSSESSLRPDHDSNSSVSLAVARSTTGDEAGSVVEPLRWLVATNLVGETLSIEAP